MAVFETYNMPCHSLEMYSFVPMKDVGRAGRSAVDDSV
jgi:hypothetical protein